jgi:hypothetical protein
MEPIALQPGNVRANLETEVLDPAPPSPWNPMNAQLPADAVERVSDIEVALAPPAPPVVRSLPLGLLVIHYAIIANLAVQCCYGTFQIFWVLQPPGTFGPMFGHATEIPFELMVARRMYAIESWIAFLGLSLYFGVTEVLPRRRA